MLREWWRPVYAAWAVTFVPVAAMVMYALRDEPALAALLLWWLKPVFDRIVLHVLSRAVFGDEVPVRRLPADWREYLSPGLAPGQLWGRIDLARSFDLPVWQLERVSGGAARTRRAVLQKRARYHAVWLTGMCAIFESIVILGLLLLVSELATPVKASSGWMLERLFGTGASVPDWGIEITLAYALAVTAIEPFYVAGGFALYLNRRTLLEGWDIELELRRCAARLADARARAATLAAAVAVLLVCWSALPQPAAAADGAAGKSARQEIREVLKDPEFAHTRETWGWHVRWPRWDVPDWLRWPDWLRFEWGGGTGDPILEEVAARLAKIALWAATGIALVWAIYYLVRRLPHLLEPDPAEDAAPPVLFGLDIAPETLPSDIAGTAARLLGEGRLREALSLLYRGALSTLVHAKGVVLNAGDTERDCLTRARAVLPREGYAYFGELVAAWQAIAYAGRSPEAGRAQGLVAAWPAHFMPAPG
jgi:hypothetical protein